MKLVTRATFAEAAKVSRAAVTKAVREKRLDIVEGGKTGRIDIDCYKSIQYLKLATIQRDNTNQHLTRRPAKKQKASKSRKGKPETKQQNNIIDIRRADKQSQQKPKPKDKKIIILKSAVTTGPKSGQTKPGRKLTEAEIHLEKLKNDLIALGHRYDIARTGKMEQQEQDLKLKNARTRGELIDREKIYNNMFTYLDKLHSNLERLADSFLSDIGPLMVDAGKVLPEHRESWKNEVLSQIDESKEGIIKILRKIEKDQSK